VPSARAAGFFDFLFGSPERPALPALVSSYAEPQAPAQAVRAEIVHEAIGGGRTVAFCVRLCDGENFPLQHYSNATPVETCRSMCPASTTKVFFGSAIDNAVARDGTRYGDLDNAYLYRKHLVAHCTCNGRDAFGLARPAVANDPTLRPGDIVVTANGLMKYAGKRGESAAYTPVDPSSIMTQLNSVTAPQQGSREAAPRASAPEQPGIILESQNTTPHYLPPVADLRGQLAR